MPKCIPLGAKSLITRILDPNPKTRITMTDIKADEWFKHDYMPTKPYEDNETEEDDDMHIDDDVVSIQSNAN